MASSVREQEKFVLDHCMFEAPLATSKVLVKSIAKKLFVKRPGEFSGSLNVNVRTAAFQAESFILVDTGSLKSGWIRPEEVRVRITRVIRQNRGVTFIL